MKKTMLALLLFGCGTLFAETHVSIGIGIGGYGPVYAPVPPPPPVMEQPPCPGEGYVWVDGYWVPDGPRFYWRQGYWRAPAYYGRPGRRVYVPAYGWNERGSYDRDHYDRDRHDRCDRDYRDDRHRYVPDEFRRDDRHDRRDEDRWRR
jgi:hypothetical protein